MTNKRKWHKVPGALQSRIESLADNNPTWSASQIFAELTGLKNDGHPKYPEIAEFGAPDPRTVQKIVKESRPADPSGAWVPTEWPGEDIPPVLEVIKYLRKRGNAIWPTLAEAKRILWVRRVAPTLSIVDAWRIVRRYMAHEAKQRSTEYLAVYLAFQSWKGPEAEKEYFAAVPERERYYPDAQGSITVGAPGTIQVQGKGFHPEV